MANQPRGGDSKRAKKRPKRAPKVSDRIYQHDFRRVEPEKIVPGVVGRSAWFAERAGRYDQSLSVDRLVRGTDVANHMLDDDARRRRVLDDAADLLERVADRDPKHRFDEPTLLGADGKRRSLTGTRKGGADGFSALCRPLRSRTGGLLVVPVDDEASDRLDLESVVGAEMSDAARPGLNSSFTYLPQQRVVVGEVADGGVHQVFAPPKDPWLRSALETLCLHWKWVERDPLVRRTVREQGGELGPGIVDRICQLILCAPDYGRIDEPGVFDGFGPPPGGLGGGKDICERCLGDFLGELPVVDDRIVQPPIVKWCWIRRPRCSRWLSIGPVPDSTFGGIGRVTQIATHPTNGNVVIAGAAGGGVWRTDNAGASWRPLMELEPTLTIGAVAFAPSDASIMYAASGEDAGNWNPAWAGVGVYRSTNHGSSWSLMTPVPSTRFSAIVVHPRRPDIIYVAGNRGLHKSVDGGVTWRTNPGLSSLFDGQVTDVVIAWEPMVVATDAFDAPALTSAAAAFDGRLATIDMSTILLPPFNAERVYIGVLNDGVYRSTTAGEQIGGTPAFERLDDADQLPSGGDTGWVKLAIGRRGAHRQRFLAAKLGASGSRIFVTTDGGDSWDERAQDVAVVSFDEWCSVIAVDPSDEDVMYAGAAGALKRTTNGGAAAADWTSINAGVHADQQDIAFDPNQARRVYLGNDGGVYRSANRGTNWTLASGKLAITQFYDIDVSEQDRDICAGGAQDNGVYYRNAAGTWRHIPWGDGTQIAIDPTDPQIFYFSSQNGVPTYIRKSVDGGASHQQIGQTGLSGGSPWITIIKLEPRHPIADPENNRVLFVCGTSQLFRSTDGGQNWQRVEDSSGTPFQPGEITALEFARSDPRILYLATAGGSVYRATNGGATAGDWTRIDTPGSPADALFPFSRVQAIRVHPFDANDVWLVFGGSGVSFSARPDMVLNPLGISHIFRNPDATDINGWQDASGQFPAMSLPDVPTSAVALADFDHNVAYAGTDVGVFRTTDGGVTWTAFQDGLPRSPIAELRFNRRYDRLFAGTMGRGVYVRDV